MIIYCKYHFALVSIELLELIFLGSFDEGGAHCSHSVCPLATTAPTWVWAAVGWGGGPFPGLPSRPSPTHSPAKPGLHCQQLSPRRKISSTTATRLPENANESQNRVLSFFYKQDHRGRRVKTMLKEKEKSSRKNVAFCKGAAQAWMFPASSSFSETQLSLRGRRRVVLAAPGVSGLRKCSLLSRCVSVSLFP